MSEQDREREIRERHAKRTKGPYKWYGYRSNHQVYLMANRAMRPVVLAFERWGMQGAQPVFNMDDLLVKGEKLLDATEHNGYVFGIKHPDAEGIQHSWADVEYLLGQLDTEREKVRKLADSLEGMLGYASTEPVFVERRILSMDGCGDWQEYEEAVEALLAAGRAK